MKSSFWIVSLALLASLQLFVQGFTVVPHHTPLTRTASPAVSSTRLNFFGQPKDDGTPGDYLCPVSSLLHTHMKETESWYQSYTATGVLWILALMRSFTYSALVEQHTDWIDVFFSIPYNNDILFPPLSKGLWLHLYQGTQSLGRPSW